MIHDSRARTQQAPMTGGDDFEGLTEEATAEAQLGDKPTDDEVTHSTYWSVQATKSRGLTRAISRTGLGREVDPEEPTAPLPSANASPSALPLLFAAALLGLLTLGCLGIGAFLYFQPTQAPPEPPPPPDPPPPPPQGAPPPPPPPATPQAAPGPEPAPTKAPTPTTPRARPPLPAPGEESAPAPEATGQLDLVPPHLDEPEPVPGAVPEPEPILSPPPEPGSNPEPAPRPGIEEEAVAAAAPPAGAEPFLLIGALSMSGPGSEAQLRNVLELARPELQACYRQALEQDPTLEAEITLSLRLLADGMVLGARARQRRQELPVLSPCLERTLLAERFPGLTGATSLTVPMSFGLSSDGDAAD